MSAFASESVLNVSKRGVLRPGGVCPDEAGARIRIAVAQRFQAAAGSRTQIVEGSQRSPPSAQCLRPLTSGGKKVRAQESTMRVGANSLAADRRRPSARS